MGVRVGIEMRSQTVLLAEDQEAVRHVARVVLERAGFHVIATADAREARARALEHGLGNIDALVTDVVMPGQSGPELAAELRAMQPSMPVLFVSGYSEDLFRHGGPLGAGEAFLAKPFTPDSLVHHLRELLAEDPAKAAAAG